MSFSFRGNDLVREAELDEVRNSVQKITSANLGTEVNKLLDPGGDFAAELARTEEEMQAALRDTRNSVSATGDAITAEVSAATAIPSTPETPFVAEAIAEAPAEPDAPPPRTPPAEKTP